jgi:hypothetical protein
MSLCSSVLCTRMHGWAYGVVYKNVGYGVHMSAVGPAYAMSQLSHALRSCCTISIALRYSENQPLPQMCSAPLSFM